MGFPGGASGKEPGCQCRRSIKHGFNPQVGKAPWRRAWQPTPVFLPGESHGQRSLASYSLQGHTESDMTQQLNHHCSPRLEESLSNYKDSAQPKERNEIIFKKEEGNSDTETREKMRRAETRVMSLHSTDCRHLVATSQACCHLDFGRLPSRLRGTEFPLFQATVLRYSVMAALGMACTTNSRILFFNSLQQRDRNESLSGVQRWK